jgi:hypothetical protein
MIDIKGEQNFIISNVLFEFYLDYLGEVGEIRKRNCFSYELAQKLNAVEFKVTSENLQLLFKMHGELYFDDVSMLQIKPQMEAFMNKELTIEEYHKEHFVGKLPKRYKEFPIKIHCNCDCCKEKILNIFTEEHLFNLYNASFTKEEIAVCPECGEYLLWKNENNVYKSYKLTTYNKLFSLKRQRPHIYSSLRELHFKYKRKLFSEQINYN